MRKIDFRAEGWLCLVLLGGDLFTWSERIKLLSQPPASLKDEEGGTCGAQRRSMVKPLLRSGLAGLTAKYAKGH